jgi:hypothetical protein
MKPLDHRHRSSWRRDIWFRRRCISIRKRPIALRIRDIGLGCFIVKKSQIFVLFQHSSCFNIIDLAKCEYPFDIFESRLDL